MYGNNYFRTLRKLHKLISVFLTNLLCIFGLGYTTLNSVSVSRDFSHTKSCTNPHKYSFSAFSGIPQTKKEKILPHSFSLPCTPQPLTFLPHPPSNINATLRITDRKITEILEIKIFHHRFQQKCYQPTTSPYLI